MESMQKSSTSGSRSGMAPKQVPAQGGQYLTLRLGSEEYAIDILQVQEIRSYEEPTRMVNAPSFVKGVINLRGVIVPIADLRVKLNLEQAPYNDSTVVIIMNVHGVVIGAVVDSVSDVVNLATDAIRSAPQFDAAIDARFITGLVNLGERMLIVMNVETLLGNAEMGLLPATAAQ